MKKRLDIALVDDGHAPSRARAQALIKSGVVMVNDMVAAKANYSVKEGDKITLTEADHPWVSRGGLKLAGAEAAFDLSFVGKTILDIGASTGGFTDVALAGGAAKVFAVDVGAGQLATKLVSDTRVISMENTNARDLDETMITEPVDMLVCDASFISLKLVLPAGLALVKAGGEAVVLIKPQFEVGKGRVGKGGIVKDSALHTEVCEDISNWFKGLGGWSVIALVASPIDGPDGNKEFLLYAKKAGA